MSDCVIYCGDCRDVAPSIEGPINAIITDPPYGVAYNSNAATRPERKRWSPEIANDGDVDTSIGIFLEAMKHLVAKTAEQAEMYVFTRWDVLQRWIDAVNVLDGFKVKNVLVWDKGMVGQGDIVGNWANSHELIIYAKKGRRPIKSRKRSSIMAVQRVDKEHHIHPTEKPVPLIEILLDQSTSPGDLVVDPFAGSGSTIVACHRLDRRGIGIELDPEFHRRATARIQQGLLF